MKKYLTATCIVAVIVVVGATKSCYAADVLDISALDILMRLFDVIAKKNPNYDDTLSVIAKLDPEHQEERLAALAERNSRDPQIAMFTDSLLKSDAYKIYFRQFKNVTPDIHSRVFASLPYRAIQSPADIGQVQLGLFHHRDKLSVLVKKVSQVDIDRSVSIARYWSPPSDLPVPAVYFILDGNADAFAREGVVCFDLYGVLLSKLPESSRYDSLANVSTGEIEGVLAHEFQHVFALPYLYPPTRKFDNWQELWEDIIIRRMVSEGVALQCNPLSGFRKAIYEDSVIVSFWLRELERIISKIRTNQTTEDSVRIWLDCSYQESARQLLIDYLKRSYPKGDQRVMLSDHISERPSCVYVLGWWIISHIVAAANGHDSAVQLLTTPHQLFRVYNAAVTDSSLKITL